MLFPVAFVAHSRNTNDFGTFHPASAAAAPPRSRCSPGHDKRYSSPIHMLSLILSQHQPVDLALIWILLNDPFIWDLHHAVMMDSDSEIQGSPCDRMDELIVWCCCFLWQVSFARGVRWGEEELQEAARRAQQAASEAAAWSSQPRQPFRQSPRYAIANHMFLRLFCSWQHENYPQQSFFFTVVK